MADVSSATTFYEKGIPGMILFKTAASDGDYFKLPYGVAVEAICSSTDDDDEIATAVCSGSTVTIGLIDDEGNAQSSDHDIVGCVILKNQ